MEYAIKYGEEVRTVVGVRIQCPYCNILIDKNDVGHHGDSGQCPLCQKVFVIRR